MNLINSAYHTNIAFITPDGMKATYEELSSFSERIKTHLFDKPLLFALCENTPGSLLGYTAFIANGAVPLMLDAKIDAGLLQDLLNIYQPNFIWLPDHITHVFKSEKKVFSEAGYSLHLLSSAEVALHQDLALLLTTSGSTGSPKLVRLSYKNIFANARSITQYLDIDEKERPVTSLPMHYSFGLSVINSHLISGATLLLTSLTLLEREFWNFAREQQVTSLSGVPYTFEMLHRLRFFRMNLPALKTLTQAGGKLSAGLIEDYCEQCRKSGKQFIVMYGQTEATARMSYLPFDRTPGKYGSIGVAIPGGTFILTDEEGKEVIDPEVDGELVYMGDNVSLGYAEEKSDLAKGDENRGTLRTGDIARRDKDGFYYITGRLKRFVKLYGNRVNLDAIEQLLRSRDEGEYVCAGIDDHLIIYTTHPGKREKIIHFLSEKTGINSQAFTVKEIPEIPKNSSGKILYTELSHL